MEATEKTTSTRAEGAEAMTATNDHGGPTQPAAQPPAEPSEPTLAAALAAAVADPKNRVMVAGAGVCVGLFVLLFQESLWHFHYAWTTDDNYSHGFLVPLISLYFAARVFQTKRDPLPAPERSGALLGFFMMAAALAVHLLTIPLPIPFLADLALLAALAGGFAIVAGTAALKRYWFPFFFLIFMVPLPIALYTKIASPLQLMASQAASTFMNATGVPVLREGNRMTLPGGVQMFVAEACSGMRQLTGFLALAAAVAYLCGRPAWYRIVVVASALPIALFANILRIVITGYIMHFVNPAYAVGAYHTLEGILLMAFGLLLLNTVCAAMDLFLPEPDAGREPETRLMAGPRQASFSPREKVAGTAG